MTKVIFVNIFVYFCTFVFCTNYCLFFNCYCFNFAAGFNSLPRSLTNTSDEYNTSVDSSTPMDNSSVLETLIEDQEIASKSKKYFIGFYIFKNNYLK